MDHKILLVDGNNLLFQMFFGMPARIYNHAGEGIWGVLGFVGALLKMLRLIKPTHAAVLFDGEHENSRALLDADYKGNRVSFQDVVPDENPFSQLPFIYAALDCLNIAHAETETCEADDWVAAFAAGYGKENDLVIASFDSDFFQLITDRVTVFRYRGKKSYFCDGDYLREKFGVEPWQYADFKSLTGDAADNIRGAAHVGPKTAAELLREFGTLAGVVEHAERIRKPSVRASILEGEERLRRNYRLIKLDGGAELPFGLEDMRYVDSGVGTMEVLREAGIK